MIYLLIDLMDKIVTIFTWLIVARALLSWFSLSPDHPAVRILDTITEPILAPLRRFIPLVGMMDITPLVAILLVQAVWSVIRRILIGM